MHTTQNLMRKSSSILPFIIGHYVFAHKQQATMDDAVTVYLLKI